MKHSTILNQLADLGVPSEKATWAAKVYGDKPEPRKPKPRYEKVDLQATKFRLWCQQNNIPLPTPEFKFHPKRRWRADFAWPNPDGGGVLLEVDGGGHVRGRHHRPAG